jgi:hypothetical protein
MDNLTVRLPRRYFDPLIVQTILQNSNMAHEIHVLDAQTVDVVFRDIDAAIQVRRWAALKMLLEELVTENDLITDKFDYSNVHRNQS